MNRIVAWSLLALLTLPGCGKKEAPVPQAEPTPSVRGARVEAISPSKVSEEIEAVGTIQSRERTVLSSKLTGTVVALHVRVGDRVGKGQVVAEIDAREAQAQLSKAQAGEREADAGLAELERADAAAEQGLKAAEVNRDLASATYDRFKSLTERGVISRQEYDDAEARYKAAVAQASQAENIWQSLAARKNLILARRDQARADIANTQAMLSYATVRSPIAGVVVDKPAEVGIVAAPGIPLVIVEDEGHYRLEASVEEKMLSRVRQGDPVRVRIDALGGEDFWGKVDEIVPAADPLSRTYIVKIVLEGLKGLRSGIFGRAMFQGEEKPSLLVPKTSLLDRGQLTGVYVVDTGNVAHFRIVKTGREYAGRMEVLSGISPGEKIVVEGMALVSDGSRLE
jgi:multidrug efflux pump subunit AcrA (membrane-fusion protein)